MNGTTPNVGGAADAPVAPPRNTAGGERRLRSRVLVLAAQGFGVGRIRPAPGTWGSLLGVLWFLVLLWPRHLGVFTAGALTGLIASVWICGAAERILGRTDPPSVVLDELVAIPLCYAGWVGWVWLETGQVPAPAYFLRGSAVWLTLGIFLAFRAFDIAKPWPIGAAQRLRGGWGVTADDALAALAVNGVAAILAQWIR